MAPVKMIVRGEFQYFFCLFLSLRKINVYLEAVPVIVKSYKNQFLAITSISFGIFIPP
jgi:hypothetical protein